MIKATITLVLALVFIYPAIRLKDKNLFHPIRLISFIFFIRNIPYLFFICLDNENFNWRVQEYLDFKNITLDNALIVFAPLKIIEFLFFLLPFYLKTSKTTLGVSKLAAKIYPKFSNTRALKRSIKLSFLIGLVGFLIFLNNVGGAAFLISNLNDRVNIQSGQQALKLKFLLPISVLFLIYNKRFNKKIFNAGFIILLTLTILILSSTGGRKDSLFLIFFAFAFYSTYVTTATSKSLFKLKSLIVYGLVALFILIIPILRSKDGVNKNINEELKNANVVYSLAANISYVYIDVFAANHFNFDNLWMFSSLRSIPENLNRNTSTEQRPPIDEGVYFSSIIDFRRHIKPPIPRNQLREFGFPIENFGFGFANGHVLGLLFSSFFLGCFHKINFLAFQEYKNPLAYYFFIFNLINFNFSSLRIANLLILLVCFIMFSIIYLTINSFFRKTKKLPINTF